MATEEEFIPRDYQIDLYEKAVKGNVILYLPTGAGKTFIAIMLIKHMSADLRKPWDEGKKLTIFLVNTVPLVEQQCGCISRQTDLKCSGYSGEMNVDFWSKDQWLNEFKLYQVLIMTSQILLDLLTKSFLPLPRINLIIFDECHRGVKDHPMRQIMKAFEVYDKAEHPKILGLTATLLNSNVVANKAIEPVEQLEITFNARVVSIDSISIKNRYGNPCEKPVEYDPPVESAIFPKLREIIESASELLKIVHIQRKNINESSLEFQPDTANMKLKRTFEDIAIQLSELGLYPGNIGILHYMIQVERYKHFQEFESRAIYDYIKTIFIRMQKIIYQQMNEPTEIENIIKYSSDKVKQLLNVLKRYFNEMKQKDHKFCCIIFVQRRFTAKVLYHVLKKISEFHDGFKFLVPEYIVGNSSDPFKKPVETMCLRKWNFEGLLKFRSGESNCLVATQVLEEGVDVPHCNLVINFDSPLDFRSYVQSRGRARDASSFFLTFIERGDDKFSKRHTEFKNVENTLNNHIVENPNERNEPLPEMIKTCLYEYAIKPYVVMDQNGEVSQITEVSAIPSLNQYCSKLSQSKFAFTQPVYKLYKVPSKENEAQEYFLVSISLSLLSPLRDVIHGSAMPSKTLAKRSAAMAVCKKLHQIGEFTNRLLPREIDDIADDITISLKYWQYESPDNNKKVGETSNKRSYDVIYPQVLEDAFPSPNEDVYLHVIDTKPMYPLPTDNRDRVLFNLLGCPSNFAILSSKKIPKLPEFSIYMKMGRVNVKLHTNLKCIKLSSEEIQELRHFHWLIFKDILSLIKDFMIFDSRNKENNFLIVPTDKDGELNWPVIRNYKSVEKVYPEKIPHNAITNGIDDVIPENYSDWELVSPKYRSATNIYIVTQVCYDLNPQSTFPTEDYVCYSHYFAEKHKIKISDIRQPLLEVKPISDKINFIKKRAPVSSNKRKRENLEEHLIPELCCKINFPAIYYLKAQTLPSILHRINQLIIAEELRQQIATEAQLGSISVFEDQNRWETLCFSDDEISSDEEIPNENTDDTDDYSTQIEDVLDEVQFDDHDNEKEDIKIESDINILSLNRNNYPWTKVKEPCDLERNISSIQLIHIEYYNIFQNSLYSLTQSNENPEEFCARRQTVDVPSLTIINKTTGKGPGAADLLPALIVKRANDSINLERLETLGDSFLKFIISLYLFEKYPYQSEGRLTGYKGKIIGNRYLYYCGVNKKIPGRLKVEDFVPKSNFIVPSYYTPHDIQQMIHSQNKAPSVLYEITIPPSEQFQGVISDEIRNKSFDKISEWINPSDSTELGQFINIQNIPDKTIADSVEAIIGVYLENMNILGAGKLLQWFGIIPDTVNIQQILFGTPTTAALQDSNINHFINWADNIENVLGYKFKDRSFLLQAFTHSSYYSNKVTLSYDRLEFLGDAVIDFLITIYIYENCNNLNPGELTDLRSALVNNVTFACLAVKYRLNTALLAYAPYLFESIDSFVKFQHDRHYVVDDELLWVLLEEEDCDVAESVDVPKVLGDLFESVIGAIYLDSGKDLNKTWSILYSLMHEEINKFSKNVPKQAIRVLYETPGAKPEFLKSEIHETTRKLLVTLRIQVLGHYKYFHGFGSTKKLAKIGAAKRALKYLQQQRN